MQRMPAWRHFHSLLTWQYSCLPASLAHQLPMLPYLQHPEASRPVRSIWKLWTGGIIQISIIVLACRFLNSKTTTKKQVIDRRKHDIQTITNRSQQDIDTTTKVFFDVIHKKNSNILYGVNPHFKVTFKCKFIEHFSAMIILLHGISLSIVEYQSNIKGSLKCSFTIYINTINWIRL